MHQYRDDDHAGRKHQLSQHKSLSRTNVSRSCADGRRRPLFVNGSR
jgi:hypothetical protein